MADTRSLVLRGFARPDGDRLHPGDSQAQLRQLVDDVSRLDLEVETLAAALADFSGRYERTLADAFHELHTAERLLHRLRALEDGLRLLAERLERGELPAQPDRAAVRRHEARRRAEREAGPHAEEPAAGGSPAADRGAGAERPASEPVDLMIKRLYRRLARLLHPDLARDGERDRLGELMARANAAYAKGDLASLTILAEKVGAGETLADLSPEQRQAYCERRLETLSRAASSLGRERDRLLASDTRRLWEEARRRDDGGGNYFEEARQEIGEDEAAAYAEVMFRLQRLASAAANLSRARDTAMSNIVKPGSSAAQRAFDPLRETDLVRQGAARLGRQRASPAARLLARALEESATGAPWEVALTLFAFFAEDAGARPPDGLSTPEGWLRRWELVRPSWPGTPALPRLLARLPRHLTLGARSQGEAVVAGPQLAEAELTEGVRLALDSEPVARIARPVLAALGPEGACPACGPGVPARHLLRTRGLDEQHGLVCPGCRALLRGYWRYGEVEALEALAPHALKLGLVAEVTVQLGGTVIGFQMLPGERQALTAEGLRARFAQLYLTPYEVPLAPEAVAVLADGVALDPDDHLAEGAALQFTPEGAGTTAEQLVELLRVRIERRFRP